MNVSGTVSNSLKISLGLHSSLSQLTLIVTTFGNGSFKMTWVDVFLNPHLASMHMSYSIVYYTNINYLSTYNLSLYVLHEFALQTSWYRCHSITLVLILRWLLQFWLYDIKDGFRRHDLWEIVNGCLLGFYLLPALTFLFGHCFQLEIHVNETTLALNHAWLIQVQLILDYSVWLNLLLALAWS